MGLERKKPCSDCQMCQFCSEARCKACRGDCKSKGARRLSIKEQIELFNRMNPDLDLPEKES